MHLLQRIRYRLAARMGRFLVGGRLDALERQIERLATERDALAAARRGAESPVAGGEGREEEADPQSVTNLREELARLRGSVDEVRGQLKLVSRSIPFLLQERGRAAGRNASDLVVSVIVPVRNREALLVRTIESVLGQDHTRFELVIVDDGSTDGTASVAERFAAKDPRVRLLRQPWSGPSAARNRALREARGDVIAYLDSDVTMAPGYLGELAAAYQGDAEMKWSYAARLLELLGPKLISVQFEPFDRRALEQENYVDTNVIAHRRGLEGELGGWDESLGLTCDWELALRWSARVPPRPLPFLACSYDLGREDQFTCSRPHGWDNFRVMRRYRPRRDLGIRVLYVAAHYPQLTESYIEQEIRAARDNGVHVEVWGFEPPESPFETDVPVHSGTLEQAVRECRPDLLQVQWLGAYFNRGDELRATGLPIFVRGHGYELSAEKVARLEADPAVSVIFLVPHFAERWGRTPKVIPAWVGFRPDLYHPGGEKDRRLVFRAAAGLPAKNLDALIELAARNPELRFVLAVGRAGGHGAWVDGLLERHRASGSPLEIVVNLPHERVAELSRRAGIYLHTHTLEQPFSSPISIVEAMASGSYVLVPQCASARRYAAEAAEYYGDIAEAERHLRGTLGWGDEDWRRRERLAIDRAFDHFEMGVAILPILKCWLGALRRPWPG